MVVSGCMAQAGREYTPSRSTLLLTPIWPRLERIQAIGDVLWAY